MNEIDIDPAQLCRAFFILTTAAAIGANAIPPLRKRLVLYGARSILGSPGKPSESRAAKSNISSLIDSAAKFQVPHSWFAHFYVASVLSSVFWAYQITTNGVAFRYLSSHYGGDTQETMTWNQIIITWVFMALQGSRRLYECITLFKPSQAKMPLFPWALGIAFYLGMGISVWVEGIPTLRASRLSLDSIMITMPTAKTFIAVLLFLLASGIQHDCHEYLASLKKYTLPEHQLFQWVLCPHYTSECVIYLSLAIVAAPKGQILNKTISTVLLFTVTNLAITAESTRVWYVQKFGAEKIKQRWRMAPLLY